MNESPERARTTGHAGRRGGSSLPKTLALAAMLAALGSVRLAARSTTEVPPADWPPELGEAFKLYYAGDFDETQRLCRRLNEASRNPRLRRETAALAALATMRLPGRDNRLGGQARLTQLAEGDPSLLARPECLLACGIAQAALSETAAALHNLRQAAETFAEQGRTSRLVETCVALAETWARHGEWELPVPGLKLRRPESPAEADRIRLERIRGLRQRVAALPDSEPYLERIDLILARRLLSTEGGAAEGLALLKKLAGREPLTSNAAQACLALAEHCENERRWTEAARLYERVQNSGLGTFADEARRRRDAIERPQLTIDLPRQVAAGESVAVDLRARNLSAVEFEVRRVDLVEHLEQRQGRFVEALLPTSGALIAARDLDTSAATGHGWWSAETLDQPLVFDAPLGPMVVSAQATDGTGHVIETKRLVVAGDLQATVFIGGRRVVIWATRGGRIASTAEDDHLQARFWMHGSFVPARPRFSDDVAIFPLPPEARLLRDKRWVCLVQSGDEVALCDGELDASIHSERNQAVAVTAGPPAARVGEDLNLFGLLLGSHGDDLMKQPPSSVALELLDALDDVLCSESAPVSSAGTFSARLQISASMAGENVQVATRLNGQVLDSVFARPSVRIAPADETALRVHCTLPAWLPADSESVIGQIEAACPWGYPLSGGSARVRIRAARLPSTQPRRDQAFSQVLAESFTLDSDGKTAFARSLSDFDLPDGVLAVGVQVDVAGWDGRYGQAYTETLVGPEPTHLWLRCKHDAPQIGEPLYASVGWFDPAGRSMGARPAVNVWHDGTALASLQLRPTLGGMRTEAWRPTAPGEYELVATLPLAEGNPLSVREPISVAPGSAVDEHDASTLRFEGLVTVHDDRPSVLARLYGRWDRALLFLLEDGDPLAARQLASLDGSAELLIPLPTPHRAEMRLILASPDPGSAQILGVVPVRVDGAHALTLALSSSESEPSPDATVEITATCLRGGQPARDVTLMGRLVDASQGGGIQWLPGEVRPDLTFVPGGIQLASSAAIDADTAASGRNAGIIPETRELPAELAQALFDGLSLWVDSQRIDDGRAVFAVRLPPEPGLYRLTVTAHAPDGGFACQTLHLDTRGGLDLAADAPARLTVGDRCVASLVITNRESTPVRARVSFDGGAELHLDELRLLGKQDQLQRTDDDGSWMVAIAPRETQTLRAGVEATRPGEARATFVVEIGQRHRSASAPCRVDPRPALTGASESTAPESIVLHRSLFLLEKEEEASGDIVPVDGNIGSTGAADWIRLEIQPGERLREGRLVLVQEEFVLESPLVHVEWRQSLPGNCCTHAGDWSDFLQIGTRRALRLDAVTYGASKLDPGRRHIHEYVIVPGRPGACWFPTPEVRADGQPVRVTVESAHRMILVADGS